jgi:hypothetical protein
MKREMYSVSSKLNDKTRNFFGIYLESEIGISKKVRSRIFVRGYFQDLKLLPDWAIMAPYLEVKESFGQAANEVLKEFLKVQPVIIHIRRGDYLTQDGIYGVLTNNYYEKALQLIEERIGAHKVWLMSDDPEGAIEWLGGTIQIDRVFDQQNLLKPYEIIEIASNAKALVMANSTFSWWIGYIGSKRGTLENVVMPHRFTRGETPPISEKISLPEWQILNHND